MLNTYSTMNTQVVYRVWYALLDGWGDYCSLEV